MAACYHLPGVMCENCRSPWYEEMHRQRQVGDKIPFMPPPFVPQIPQQSRGLPCQHCFCGEPMVNGKKHEECCMCGHRRLAS